MDKLKTIKVTKVILDIMFYGGILVFITLPLTLKLAGKYYSPAIQEHFLMMLLVFGASGGFGIMIISQLRRMMKTVSQENCFVYDNVKSLSIMSALSLCIAVMFILKLFFLPTPATGVIILVFFVAALFSEVLSHVFAEAVRYKEENDLTI